MKPHIAENLIFFSQLLGPKIKKKTKSNRFNSQTYVL